MGTVRRESRHDLESRLAAFERHYCMTTATLLERYDEDEDVDGVHPHIAALWYGTHLQLSRMQPLPVEELEALLA